MYYRYLRLSTPKSLKWTINKQQDGRAARSSVTQHCQCQTVNFAKTIKQAKLSYGTDNVEPTTLLTTLFAREFAI